MAAVSKPKNRNSLEMVIILSVFLAANIASQVFQLHITYNNGQSFDGVFYYKVAYQFSKGMKPSSEAPFVYRLGTPFLVSVFFKNDLLFGFKPINITANLLSTIILILWLRYHLSDWRIRTLLVVLFITQWHGPVRFTYYDPAFTDPWLFVFLLIGLIGIQKIKLTAQPVAGESAKKVCVWSVRSTRTPFLRNFQLGIGLLGLISFIGVVFREAVLIIPFALIFITNPIPLLQEITSQLTKQQIIKLVKKPYYPAIVPVVLGIAGIFLVQSIASQNNDYSFAKTAFDWAYDKPVLTYIHAYFITYGPLIIIPVYFWRRTFNYLWNNQYMLVYLAGFLVLGWIGGSDTERFLFWAMPVVYLLIGIEIEENRNLFKSPWLILLLAASTICSSRLFWTVADFPNIYKTPFPILSILSNKFQYLDLWSFFAKRPVQAISLLEYLLLSALLLWWLNRGAKQRVGNDTP